MRIAHITPYISLRGGGVPPVVQALAKEQVKLGHDVSIFASDEGGGGLSKSDGYNLVLCKQVGPRRFCYVPSLIKEIINYSPQIVHSHGVWTYFSFAGHIASRKLKVPHVISTHGMYEPWAWRWHGARKKIAQFFYQGRIFSSAKKLFSHASEISTLRSLGLSEKTFLMANGVDESFLRIDKNKTELVKLYPELNGKKIILFMSRIHPKKGLVEFISVLPKLFEKYPDWFFLIAGPDEAGYSAVIKSNIHRIGLDGKVMWIGPVRGALKNVCLSAADLFVLTSYSEGFSISVLEALAAGTPVCVSDKCYFDEIVSKGCGVVCEMSFDSIYSSVEKILSEDENSRKLMGHCARQLVREKYLWSKIIKNINEEYEKLIHQ